MTDRTSIRVGMWGTGASGMTTFLAAARAAARVPSAEGSPPLKDCRVDDRRPASGALRDADADAEAAEAALRQGRFPQATLAGSVIRHDWTVSGQYDGRRFAFPVTVLDRPGADFCAGARDAFRDYRDCQAFLYLLDLTHPDPATAVSTLPEALAAGSGGDLLPQHVVVCLAKYDDPRIFERICERYVPADNPRERRLYRHAPLPSAVGDLVGDHAPEVVRELQRYFHRDRIHYLATSAIGFLRVATDEVDLDCYAKVTLAGGEPRIDVPLRPVNVLQPFVLLHEKVG